MKKIYRKSIMYLIILVTSFSLAACYSELEDLDFGDIQWSPELGLPLIDSKFTLIEILKANISTIDYSADANNTIVLTISEDSLFSQSASDYYALSNQSLNVPPIILTQSEINSFNNDGQVTVTRDLMVNYPNHGSLDEIVIDQGRVVTQVTEDFPADLELSFSMTDPMDIPIVNYNNRFDYTLGQSAISTDESSERFNNIKFRFDGDPSLAQVKFSFTINLQKEGGQDLVFGANSIILAINMRDLEFGGLYGDLSPQNISTERNTIRTDFFTEDEFFKDIEYYFENPQFKMIFTNSMGLPVRFDVNNFSTYKNGQETNEPVNTAIELEAPNEGEFTRAESEFNAIFKRIINEVPDSISLQVDGLIDPNNTPNNFVTRDSRIKAGYEINLPLELSLSGLEINESITLDGIDPGGLQYALFKFSSTNSLPIDLNFKADLLDEDSVFVMNLFDGRFIGAGSEAQPESISGIIKLLDNPDTNVNEIEALKNVTRVGIKATIATKNNGNEVVRITSDASVQFNLAVQAKYKVNLE